jgi:hypothetical protein
MFKLFFTVSLVVTPTFAAAQDSATADEVLQKTREAAAYLAKEGADGLATFRSKNPLSWWKADGYIFVFDCEDGKMLANANLAIADSPLSSMRDRLGFSLAKPLCENGQRRKWGLV